MFDELIKKPGFWSLKGPFGDVVLSTRIRLARNMPSINFPHRMGEQEHSVFESIARRFIEDSEFHETASLILLRELEDNDRRFLRERNLITLEMENSPDSLVVLERDERFVIMINEEDHFRIQVIKPGFQIMEAYGMADLVDEELNKFAAYAYCDDFGYLTACPSNMGTGLKVSTMLHLPAITMNKTIGEVITSLRDRGINVKGTTGETNRTFGSLYLISNRPSLGLSEVDIIEEIDKATKMLIEMENEARDGFASSRSRQIEDSIWRSFGILRYTRSISYIEAIEHLSGIRLGIVLSIIKNIDLQRINDLMVNTQWYHLQQRFNGVFKNSEECDEFRADYLRAQFDDLRDGSLE